MAQAQDSFLPSSARKGFPSSHLHWVSTCILRPTGFCCPFPSSLWLSLGKECEWGCVFLCHMAAPLPQACIPGGGSLWSPTLCVICVVFMRVHRKSVENLQVVSTPLVCSFQLYALMLTDTWPLAILGSISRTALIPSHGRSATGPVCTSPLLGGTCLPETSGSLVALHLHHMDVFSRRHDSVDHPAFISRGAVGLSGFLLLAGSWKPE